MDERFEKAIQTLCETLGQITQSALQNSTVAAEPSRLTDHELVIWLTRRLYIEVCNEDVSGEGGNTLTEISNVVSVDKRELHSLVNPIPSLREHSSYLDDVGVVSGPKLVQDTEQDTNQDIQQDNTSPPRAETQQEDSSSDDDDDDDLFLLDMEGMTHNRQIPRPRKLTQLEADQEDSAIPEDRYNASPATSTLFSKSMPLPIPPRFTERPQQPATTSEDQENQTEQEDEHQFVAPHLITAKTYQDPISFGVGRSESGTSLLRRKSSIS